MRRLPFLVLLLCNFGTALAEGPRAFFGWVTTYRLEESGHGVAEVDSLVPGGPAEQAGVESGDLIVAWGGKPFAYANEYVYLQSLGAFAAGDEVVLGIERGGRRLELTLIPVTLSPLQEAAVASHMAMLRHCSETGQDCPCSMAPEACLVSSDFRTPYRRYLDNIERQGGHSVLRVAKSREGVLGYSSDPVPLPPGFALDPLEDAWLLQRLERLGPGESLAIEIRSTGEGSRRIRILPAKPGS